MSNDAAPKVLMISYACNPEGSGEHWLGWGWAEQAAKRYRVHLVTPPNAREAVTRESSRHGITPHFVAVPRLMLALTGRFGRFGSCWRTTKRMTLQSMEKIVFGRISWSVRSPS